MDPEVGVGRMSPLFSPFRIEENVLKVGRNFESKPFQLCALGLWIRNILISRECRKLRGNPNSHLECFLHQRELESYSY